MSTKKTKYYVVWKGHRPGIYDNWEECKAQVFGVEKALYKAFLSEAEARFAFQKGPSALQSTNPAICDTTDIPNPLSIAVDAACSGNPGKMEYRGVFVKTGKEIFHYACELGTNNIGEFLAIVHGLSYLKKHNLTLPMYSDSVNAIKWIKEKKCKTKLERNTQTETLYQYIERAEQWLKQNTWNTKILKWKTEKWGEIPADFGRK